jgi:phosphoadenosine phosphosulfate reductase
MTEEFDPIGLPPDGELKKLNEEFASKQPRDLIAYALERYAPRLIQACSFGAEDVALVDIIQGIRPETPMVYLDTNLLFPETYDLRDRIVARYALKPGQVIRAWARLTLKEQASRYGEELWLRDPDLCCRLRKVEPLGRALEGFSAWITGLRRDQAPTRANAGFVEWDGRFGLLKFNPLARWRAEDVWAYIQRNNVPYNALHDRCYPSLGCVPCTTPVLPGEDPRSGRWRETNKTECGLHR